VNVIFADDRRGMGSIIAAALAPHFARSNRSGVTYRHGMTVRESPPEHRGLAAIRARVRGWPGGAMLWRASVGVLGGGVILVGIVLLPLPGPGWVIIFLGLGLWSTEFTWAARLLARARGLASEWTMWIRRKPRWVHALVGLSGLALAIALVLATWYLL
jgi:uncharacterized protein (TIGR02611 family)